MHDHGLEHLFKKTELQLSPECTCPESDSAGGSYKNQLLGDSMAVAFHTIGRTMSLMVEQPAKCSKEWEKPL